MCEDHPLPPKRPTNLTTTSEKNSIQTQAIKVVEFATLKSNFNTGRPCYSHFEDQCAIRVSDCFVKSGISMASFSGVKCWYTEPKRDEAQAGWYDFWSDEESRKLGITGVAKHPSHHALRAEELASWLLKRPFPGCPEAEKYTGKTFYDKIQNRTGIIFFKDYWLRSGEKDATGDHIDLYNGKGIVSQPWMGSARIQYDINAGATSFYRSKAVYFWEIK